MATTTTATVMLLISSLILIPISAIDITALLSHHPDLSNFTALLSATAIPADLASRSSITLPNALLHSHALPSDPSATTSSSISSSGLKVVSSPPLESSSPPSSRPPSEPSMTLYLSTSPAIHPPTPSLPRPHPPPTPSPMPPSSPSSNPSLQPHHRLPRLRPRPHRQTVGTNTLALNIIDTLIQAQDFNVAASMLAASSIALKFEQDQQDFGISLFIPIDSAFATLSQSSCFRNLSDDHKTMVFYFHALHSYYPLGSLQYIGNPI